MRDLCAAFEFLQKPHQTSKIGDDHTKDVVCDTLLDLTIGIKSRRVASPKGLSLVLGQD
ncbi:uncharacterized protein CC84DRAFT_1170066, partial [Paraphaeosphaeria sporulosa]